MVTLIAEALDGLGVIQAYNKQQYFTHITSEVRCGAAWRAGVRLRRMLGARARAGV